MLFFHLYIRPVATSVVQLLCEEGVAGTFIYSVFPNHPTLSDGASGLLRAQQRHLKRISVSRPE